MSGKPTRRAVVTGGAATVAITALGGCATYGTPAAAPTAAPTSPVTLGKKDDIPVGGGKVFAGARVVVTQPSAGSFKAFTAVCTHAGCLVDSVSGGTINCPCHGSKYKIADGSVAQGPAPKALAPATIDTSTDTITLT
jgi:Rieske Fe-S protein